MPVVQVKRDASTKKKKRHASLNANTLTSATKPKDTPKEPTPEPSRKHVPEDTYVTSQMLLDESRRIPTSPSFSNPKLCGWTQVNLKEIITEMGGLNATSAKSKKGSRASRTTKIGPKASATAARNRQPLSHRSVKQRDATPFVVHTDIDQYITEYRERKLSSLRDEQISLFSNAAPPAPMIDTNSPGSGDLYK